MKADLINVDVGIGAIVQFGKLQAASVICGQGAALTDARRARRHSEKQGREGAWGGETGEHSKKEGREDGESEGRRDGQKRGGRERGHVKSRSTAKGG